MDTQPNGFYLQMMRSSLTWTTCIIIFCFFPYSVTSQTSENQKLHISIEELFKKAETFIQNDNHQQAYELLDELYQQARGTGIANADRYFSLVLGVNQQELFDKATLLYLMSLQDNIKTEQDISTFVNDFRFFQLIIEDQHVRDYLQLTSDDFYELGNSMKEFWVRVDPTPGVPANQRLIEHRLRVSEAKERFPDPDSETGVDGRGETFIRYGEPDRIIDRPLHISRGEIFGFVSEFQMMKDERNLTRQESLIFGSDLTSQTDSTAQSRGSSSNPRSQFTSNLTSSLSSDFDAARIADNIIDVIYSNPFQANLRIWIYYRFNHKMNENLILYFSEQKKNVFTQLSSLEDWIPQGLFTASSRSTGVNFSPALPLQYLAYQRLMHDDRHFMDIYNRMDQEIFNYPADRSDSALLRLSSQIRSQNQRATHLLESSAPREHSTELEKLPNIPIEVHQYRALDINNKPVFTTFIESRPVVAFVQDLTASLENIEDEIYVSPEMFNNYRIEQGVELYGTSMQLRGRLRGNPYFNVDQDRDSPTRIIVDIPATDEVSEQIFYSKLINQYKGNETGDKTIFPKELRGLGRIIEPLPNHFDPESEGIFVSDLILGYERIDEDQLRFPFIVRHNRVIPQNENLVVHFEVYNLKRGETRFTEFEVEYQIESQSRSRGLFRRSSEVYEGVLEFTSGSNRFSESLEFEDLPLKPGRYTLTWSVRDLQSNHQHSQELEFEVAEGY